MLTLGSLFDGIGGWLLAAVRNGVKPVWSSEIEDFPMKVSHAHFPDVVQLGDVTKIDGSKVTPVDIICAGSPCQDLSISGDREGLKGKRSGLFHEAIRVVREMRRGSHGGYPRFFVWENVPGAFSSNKGMDFRTVLEEITEAKIPMPKSGRWVRAGMVRSDKCEVTWRTLDAQYFGIPQHRERLFLVADFGGRSSSKILFERKSMSGDFETSKEEGASNSSDSVTGAGEHDKQFLFENHSNDSRYRGPLRFAPTLTQRMGTGGNNQPFIVGNGQMHQIKLKNKAGALNCMHDQQILLQSMTVRRITPLECERLQGLPDGWTGGGSDTARYKTLGNGMAQPCADFIISKVVEAFEKVDG